MKSFQYYTQEFSKSTQCQTCPAFLVGKTCSNSEPGAACSEWKGFSLKDFSDGQLTIFACTLSNKVHYERHSLTWLKKRREIWRVWTQLYSHAIAGQALPLSAAMEWAGPDWSPVLNTKVFKPISPLSVHISFPSIIIVMGCIYSQAHG